MNRAAPIRLSGERVTREPLARDHAADLAEAAVDGELSTLWRTSAPSPDGMIAAVEG